VSEYDPAAFDAFEEAGWTTKESAAYESLAGRVTSGFADALLDAVGTGAGTRLLDVATGPGYVAARGQERGADVVGLDFSEKMLASARSRARNVEFVRGDATALAFEDATFDAVTGAFVILHLGRPEQAVAEAWRVLASEGRAAFTVWDEPSRSRWIGVLFDAFMAAGGQLPADVPHGPPIFKYADDREFEELLAGAGFDDVGVEAHEHTLRIDDATELWDGLAEGSVRLRPMMLGQPEDLQGKIRRRFDELLEAYRTDRGLEVPVAVKLASGRKP